MFRQFDKRKKLLHNLASVLMKFFTKFISKAVENQRSETRSARDEVVGKTVPKTTCTARKDGLE
jgi:hypothetical protein